MKIRNTYAQLIYKYIYCHDGETILQYEMANELGMCTKTARKYTKWLEKRNLIRKQGKKYSTGTGHFA